MPGTQIEDIVTNPTDAIGAAMLRDRKDLARRSERPGMPGEVAAIAMRLKKTTEKNAHAELLQAGIDLGTLKNQTKIEDIHTFVQGMEVPAGSPNVRQQTEQKLIDMKTFADEGIDAALTQRPDVMKAISDEAMKCPEVSSVLRPATPAERQKYYEKMLNNNEYRRLVQQRQQEVVANVPLNNARAELQHRKNSVITAEDALRRTDRNLETANMQRDDLQRSLDPASDESRDFADLNNEINRDPDSLGKFNLRMAEYQQLQRGIANIDAQLLQTKGTRTDLVQESRHLRGQFRTLNDELYDEYPRHMAWARTKAERAEMPQQLKELDTEIADLTTTQARQQEELKQAQQLVAEQDDHCKVLQQKGLQNVEGIYKLAAKDYFDQRVGKYLNNIDPVKRKYESEVQRKQDKELFDALDDKYVISLRGHRIGLKRGIYGDFRNLALNGEDAAKEMLKDLGYTNEDQINSLIPYYAKTMLELRSANRLNDFELRKYRKNFKPMLEAVGARNPDLEDALIKHDKGSNSWEWVEAFVETTILASELARELQTDPAEEQRLAQEAAAQRLAAGA